MEAFQVKNSATFRRDYLDDIRYSRQLVGPQLTNAHLLYMGAEGARVDDIRVRNAVRYFMGRE